MLLRSLLLNGSALALPLFAPDPPPAPPPAPPAPPAPPPGGPPPAPITAPWGSDPNAVWNLGEGGNAKPWYEAMPDGPTKELYREKKYGNPLVAADALYSANRMVNGNAIELPSIDAKPEAWEGFNTRMRGESVKAPTDYKFTFGKDAEGKDVTGDPEMVDFAQKMAFNLGIHPKRAQELIVNPWQEFAAKVNAKAVQDMNAANEAEANAVRTKWGAEFESLRAGGERVVKSLKIAPDTLVALEKHIGAAPLMDIFAQLGKMSAEGGMIGGGNSNTTDPVNMTAEQVQQKINEKRADAQFQAALNDKMNPAHASAVAELEQLHKLLSTKNKPA